MPGVIFRNRLDPDNPQYARPGKGTLTHTGLALDVRQAHIPQLGIGRLVHTGHVPTIPRFISTPVGRLVHTGRVPTLSVSGASEFDFFVSPSGSASNPGTEASPWSLEKARTTLTAGQTAALRGGTYTLSTVFMPSNSGTSTNPITLVAYPGETPIIDRGLTANDSSPDYEFNSACFDFDARNWWTLDGLEIKRGYGSNVRIAAAANTQGIVIQNCNIHSCVTADNGAAIYLGNSQASNCTIHNNTIHDRVVTDRPNTGHGVIMFNANNITITNNEFYNLACGVYHKHCTSAQGNCTVTHNIIRDITSSGAHPVGIGISWVGPNSEIEHNLIYNCSLGGIQLFEASAGCSSLITSDITLNHNTLVDCSQFGIFLQKSDGCTGPLRTIITNNIVQGWSGTTSAGTPRGGLLVLPFASQSPDSSATTFRNNLVNDSGNTNEACHLGTNYSIGALPAAITASGNIDTAPTFVNAAAHDYTLASGSAGENAALDGTDMGCDMTLVGVQ
jgi:hypothetical protein